MIHVVPPSRAVLERKSVQQVDTEWAQRLEGIDPNRWYQLGGYDGYRSNSLRGQDYFALLSDYEGALGKGSIRAELHAPQFEWDARHNRFKVQQPHALWTLTLSGGIVACRLEVERKPALPHLYRKLTWAHGLPRERFAASMWTAMNSLMRVYLLGELTPDQWDKWERPKPTGMHDPFLQWLIELPYGPSPEFDYDTYYPKWLARVKQAEASVAVA